MAAGMAVNVRIDKASIRASLGPAIEGFLDHIGELIEADAKDYAPKGETGELAESIEHEVKDQVLRVGSNDLVAVYMEEGTPPHVIRPKNGKALMWEGADHPVAIVHHPGTEARPFLRPALWTPRRA